MRLIIQFILLFSPLFLIAQTPAADSTWFVTHYTKREVYIPMRDGIKLFTAIYEPKAKGHHPFLLNRTPYSLNPYGENSFKAFWTTPYMAYLKENYIIVLQDVRGKFMSEGNFVDVRPFNPNKEGNETDEASDTWDAVDWLLKNVKNNNGKVGVWGISYPGYYATMAALSGHPAIKAVSPQAPVTEWFLGDDFHHNGALMLMDAFTFYSNFGKPRTGPTKSYNTGYHFTVEDNYKSFLEFGPLKNFTAALHDSVRFWNDLCNHSDYDAWWQNRNTRKFVQNIPSHIATLEVGGLYDAEDCYGAWNLYKAIEKKTDNKNKLVMGPWSHGGWARTSGDYLGNVRFGNNRNSEWYQKNVEIPFFDYYLLGKGDISKIHEATIFFSGANKWKTFGQWPPRNMENWNLYLMHSGGLTWDKPTDINNNEIYMQYTSNPDRPVPYTEDVHFRRTAEYMTDDQRFASRRPDVLVFKTDTLTHDITLAGAVTADLFVSISATDADFVVKLIDVFPDNFVYNDSIDGKGNGKDYPMGGYQMLVRGEIMRGRYRNSFEKPEAFVPGKVTGVKYQMPDVAHVFKKGHCIMVQVQSSWFPLADRNPQQFVDIYHCENKDFIPCDIKVYLSKEHASKIILPVIQ